MARGYRLSERLRNVTQTPRAFKMEIPAIQSGLEELDKDKE
jgi:hypothetical protein